MDVKLSKGEEEVGISTLRSLGSMDVKLSEGEEEVGICASIGVEAGGTLIEEEAGSTLIEEEVHEDEGGASLNNASVTARTGEQQVPAKVHAAARKLADEIKGVNVEEINSMINELTYQTDSSAIFNFRELSRGSLLHIAAATGRSDILGLLLEHVDANLIAAKDDWWNTPLHIATKAKAHEVADLLIHLAGNLSSGEDKNWILRRKNKHGNTALHEAVLTRDACLVRHLLSIDLEPVYWENVDRKSPLYLALDTGNSNIFRILLSHSLDPSRIEGLPPVHGAVARGQYGLLSEILKKDMKLFAMKDSKGNNVFHLAALLNKLRVFELLGPKTEYLAREENMNGDLPIHIASKRGHVALINKLHLVSRSINKRGQTVLHVATKYGRASAVRYILRHLDMGMLINERDHAGNTALHLAAIYSQPAALISLVWDERIDLFLLNYKGLAAFDIALHQIRGKHSFRKMLVATVLESASDESKDLFVQRPEAQDQAHSTLDVLRSKPNPKLYTEAINTRLVVAALVATVTFTAGFTVPGGFNGWDAASKEERGVAVMLDKRMFQSFAICNAIAMFCSMIAVIHLMMAQQSDYHKAIAALRHSMAPLRIALLAMSIAFLTGVTLTIAKLPWLANTIFYLGLIFLLLISCAIFSEYTLFFRIRCRPIRLLVLGFGLAYINWWQVYTYLLDDSKENSKAGRTSVNGHLAGAAESND